MKNMMGKEWKKRIDKTERGNDSEGNYIWKVIYTLEKVGKVGMGESRKEIKKERTKFLDERWNTGEREDSGKRKGKCDVG